MGYAEEIKKARTAVASAGTVHGLAHAMLRFHDLVHSPQQFLEELAGKAFHEIRDHGVVGLWIAPNTDAEDELECWVVWSDDAHVSFQAFREVEKIVTDFMYAKARVNSVMPHEAAENPFFAESRFLAIAGEKPPTKTVQ